MIIKHNYSVLLNEHGSIDGRHRQMNFQQMNVPHQQSATVNRDYKFTQVLSCIVYM